MVCHEFKGGIGTASRVTDDADGGWTVGVLVQANYGRRDWLRVDGVPVGEAIPIDEVPSPYRPEDEDGCRRGAAGRLGLDHRRRRDGRAAPPAPVRAPRPAGGPRDRPDGRHGLALERRPVHLLRDRQPRPAPHDVRERSAASPSTCGSVNDHVIGGLFDGVIEATEEAILNALVAAQTMTGRDGITAHALPHDRLVEVMTRYGRGPRRDMSDPATARLDPRRSGRRPTTTSPAIRSILAEHGNDGPHADRRHRRAVRAAPDRQRSERGVARRRGRRPDRRLRRDGRHRPRPCTSTDLFVDRDRLGRGIGGRCSPQLFGDDWPRTTFASDDPRALPLYIRAGMAPLWPSLYVTAGERTCPERRPGLDGRVGRRRASWPTLERAWTGVDRSVDHAFWADQAEADPFVVRRRRRLSSPPATRGRDRGDGRRALDRLADPARTPIRSAPIRRGAALAAARGGQSRGLHPGPEPGASGRCSRRASGSRTGHVHGKRAGPRRSDRRSSTVA